ncbi:ankyrin repeat domain-containing protein [archaeon]|nr:MAG: ankyrin repeat domain-containing protein [archaeon]
MRLLVQGSYTFVFAQSKCANFGAFRTRRIITPITAIMKSSSLLSILIVILAYLASVGRAAQEGGAAADLQVSHLLESCLKGDIGGIHDALDAEEHIDIVNENGWSCAMMAVATGDLDALSVTIEKGINLNMANNDGHTALMLAAREADKESVDIMLRANASPLIKTGDGSTAYSLAMQAGRQVVAATLAEAEVLHGIESEDADTVVDAVRRGAFVNIRNGAGWTPLMLATAQKRPDIVQVRYIYMYIAYITYLPSLSMSRSCCPQVQMCIAWRTTAGPRCTSRPRSMLLTWRRCCCATAPILMRNRWLGARLARSRRRTTFWMCWICCPSPKRNYNNNSSL